MCHDLRRFVPAALAAWVVVVPSLAAAQTAPPPPAAVRDVTAEISCAPQAAFVAPTSSVRIAGGQEHGKRLFGTNEAVVLNAGTAQGLKVGQEYFVRRVVADRFTARVSGGLQPLSIHTSGQLRIVDTDTDAAIAIVTSSCDGILDGDYLEPYVAPAPPPTATLGGEPDYANPGHLVLADDRRQIGGAGSMMVLDRGSDHGVRPGQRLTIYRETSTGPIYRTGQRPMAYRATGAGPIYRVGQAVIVNVNPETSLIRIDTSREAVYVGDLVAIHR